MTFETIFFTEVTDTVGATKPLGAYHCAQLLRKDGISSLVVDCFSLYSLSDLAELFAVAIGKNTVLVGISVTFLKNVEGWKPGDVPGNLDVENTFCPQGKEFENEFVRMVKEFAPNAKIVIGGQYPMKDIRNSNVDYAVDGHVGKSFVDFVRFLKGEAPAPKTHKNRFWVTIFPSNVEDDEFINFTYDWLPIDVVNSVLLTTEISRGCKFDCIFCNRRDAERRSSYSRSIDNIVFEMQSNFDRYQIYQYYINDATFNEDEKRLELMGQVVDRLSFQPEFWAYIRLDLLAAQPASLDLLYKIGLREMYFGIETMNEKTGRIVTKGGKRDKQIDMLNLIAEKYPDIVTYGNFIMGLPEESIESMLDTVERLKSKEINLAAWGMSVLKIYKISKGVPYSLIDRDYEKYGYSLLDDDTAIEDGRASHVAEWKSNITSSVELQKIWEQKVKPYASKEMGFRSGSQNIGLPIDFYPRTNEDWHIVSTNKARYVAEYRRILLELLTS